MATERFVKSNEYWCVYCKVPWEVRIVAPPGGCLLPACRSCGRTWNLAASPIDPNSVRAEPAYPERQADVSRSEEPMDIDALHSAAVCCRSRYASTCGDSQACDCGLEAALTTARQEIAALTRERDEALVNEGRKEVERDQLLSYLQAVEDEDGIHHPDWVARAQRAEAELATLRAQHRAAVEALAEVLALWAPDSILDAIHPEEAWDVRRQPTERHPNITDLKRWRAALTPASPDTAPVGEAWRPIETAPKDGTRVLLTPAVWTDERVVTAYRRGALWWIESADVRGAMRAFTPPEEDATHWPFTHWQPLPPPPATTRLDPASCRAQGHGRVSCERCGAELVGLESVRAREA